MRNSLSNNIWQAVVAFLMVSFLGLGHATVDNIEKIGLDIIYNDNTMLIKPYVINVDNGEYVYQINYQKSGISGSIKNNQSGKIQISSFSAQTLASMKFSIHSADKSTLTIILFKQDKEYLSKNFVLS